LFGKPLRQKLVWRSRWRCRIRGLKRKKTKVKEKTREDKKNRRRIISLIIITHVGKGGD
jgi:hypothetical protein